MASATQKKPVEKTTGYLKLAKGLLLVEIEGRKHKSALKSICNALDIMPSEFERALFQHTPKGAQYIFAYDHAFEFSGGFNFCGIECCTVKIGGTPNGKAATGNGYAPARDYLPAKQVLDWFEEDKKSASIEKLKEGNCLSLLEFERAYQKKLADNESLAQLAANTPRAQERAQPAPSTNDFYNDDFDVIDVIADFDDLTAKRDEPAPSIAPANTVIKFPCNEYKQPAVSGWQNYSGPVNTPIYGLVIPAGIIVIDIDTYKGVNLEKVEAALGCVPEWWNAVLQKTMHGGHHYAFRVDKNEEFRQGSNLLNITGLDTRVSGKGYIATGKGYTLEAMQSIEALFANPESLPLLPPEAVQRLRVGATVLTLPNTTPAQECAQDSAQGADCDGLEDAVNGAESVLGFSAEQVEEILSKLPLSVCDDRDQWLTVCAGVYRETHGTGWLVFDQWSQQSANYNKAANLKTFKSYAQQNGGKMITFRSVLALLEENDRKHYAGILNKSKHDFVDDYVFITAENVFCNKATGSKMCSSAFDMAHNRESPKNEDGNTIPAPIYAKRKIQVVNETRYSPFDDLIFGDVDSGETYLNIYHPAPRRIVDISQSQHVARLKAHVANLLPNEREQQILLQYLAHNVQHAGVLKRWCIVLQGVQGDGKSYFADVMAVVLGRNNTKIINGGTLESPFTGWGDGSVMTFIEELKVNGKARFEVINRLKTYITNQYVEIVNKGKDPRNVRNTANYLSFTNYPDAVPIEDNDRRFCILSSFFQSEAALLERFGGKEGLSAYHDSIYDFKNDPCAADELYTFFKTYPISDDFKAMSRAPMTSAKMAMREAGRSDNEIAVLDALEKYGDKITLSDGSINVTLLTTLYNAAFETNDLELPVKRALKNTFYALGFDYVGRKTLKDGSKISAYKKRN